MENKVEFIDMIMEIIFVYVCNNFIERVEFFGLIIDIYLMLLSLGEGEFNGIRLGDVKFVIDVGEFVIDDFIICLEDGCFFKLFKCYLKVRFNMIFDEYW